MSKKSSEETRAGMLRCGFNLHRIMARMFLNLADHGIYSKEIQSFLLDAAGKEALRNIYNSVCERIEKLHDFTADDMFDAYYESEQGSRFNSQYEVLEILVEKSFPDFNRHAEKDCKLVISKSVTEYILSAEQLQITEDDRSVFVMNNLKELFDLSESMLIILQIGLCTENILNFDDELNRILKHFGSSCLEILTGVDDAVFVKEISSKGKLGSLGFVDGKRIGSTQIRISLSSEIEEFVTHNASREEIIDCYVRRSSDRLLDIDSFNISKKERDHLQNILRSEMPCHIMLHGTPGTGKTEFSRSLVNAVGKTAVFVRADEESFKDTRKAGLAIAMKVSDHNSVIVVDEADNILNTIQGSFFSNEKTDKGWINDFMDTNRKQIIWITNKIRNIDDSTLRRFHYNLEFKPFDVSQREFMWQNILGGHGLMEKFGEDTMMEFAEKYRVNAAGIACAVETAIHTCGKDGSREDFIQCTKQGIEAHDKLINGSSGRETLNPIVSEYDHSLLNTSIDIEHVVKTMMTFNNSLKAAPDEEKLHLNLLLYGLPGTGKTEFVKFLAGRLGKRLLVKRSSDLESMYVGETEKNIAEAFREAEHSKRILFIDEADTFFTSRESAVRSWEISRTNELLTQMENFRGIFICCTNLKSLLDDAAHRRFAFKIEFKPLKPEHRVLMYQKYFHFSKPMTIEEQGLVANLDMLTPGDMRAVADSFRYCQPDDNRHDRAISMLQSEIAHRKDKEPRKAGF